MIKTLINPDEHYLGVILDLDGTLYNNTAYEEDAARRQWEYLARRLQLNLLETRALVAVRKREQGLASFSQAVYSFGISVPEWAAVRAKLCYFPERFLCAEPEVTLALERLCDHYLVAIGTNSPLPVAQRVVDILGLTHLFPHERLFTPEKYFVSKPDPKFFQGIAQTFGMNASSFISIGDREEIDITPARQMGMGGVVIQNALELTAITRALLEMRSSI